MDRGMSPGQRGGTPTVVNLRQQEQISVRGKQFRSQQRLELMLLAVLCFETSSV
jgi:hypothetical protein